MEAKDAIMRIKDFGLYHAIEDLPKSTLTVEAFNKAIELLRLEASGRLKILPCDIGDTVYIIGRCKDFPPKLDGTMWDSDGGFGTATGYYCPYEDSDLCPFAELEDCSFAEDKFGIFEDVVCHICIEEDKMWYVCENSNGYENKDFGENIFTTREEAEEKFKEMKQYEEIIR